MADLLVDTDIFVDHLRGARRLEPRDNRLFYSTLTRCELFAGAGGDEQIIRALLAPFRELAIGRVVAEAAGRLRRARRIAIADAVIAATATSNGLPLCTRNRRHFEVVPDLKVVAEPS